MVVALLFFHLLLIIFGGYFLSPEFILYPYLTEHGFVPYATLLDQHLPIIFFGPLSLPYQLVSNRPILLTLFIFLLLATDYFFYLSLTKRKITNSILFTFSLIIFSWYFGGNFFWLSTFLTFFLSLFLLLTHYQTKAAKFSLGLLLGLMFLIKPTLAPALGLLIFYFNLLNPNTIFGFLTPIFIITVYLFKLNLFPPFLDLVIEFNSHYYVALAKQFPNTRQLILFIFAFGLNLVLLLRKRLALVITLLFLVLAYPRFEYLHLQPFILILLYFTAEIKLKSWQSKALLLILISFTFLSLIKIKNYRYGDFYFNNQVVETAKQVEQLPGSTLLVLGGNELIYPLTNKVPPNLYLPPLPWYFAVESYQERLLSALEANNTPILYYPSAAVDGISISTYTSFLNDLLKKSYNRQEYPDYYLYLPKN